MILGTAGHIDHGKTTLVQALTGVDTDRLPEEKRRGITIELGFAPLELSDGTTLGVVDVPGHEGFVRTMLAGASGIDLAMLVVAADESIMPQTREHLAILALLGVRAGVVAITKCDLADAEWTALVEEEVRSALTPTPLAGVPIVRCSARTGAGLEELRAAIAAQVTRVPAHSPARAFRMPVDRAFTVKGAGTVVTGTVWSGTIAVDDAIRIMPTGTEARVRGLEVHGKAVPAATPGNRTAIALAGAGAGAERAGVEARGAMIVRASDPWPTTTVLRADVALLDHAPALGPRSRVRLHIGTADVGARVVAVGGAVGPGEVRAARVVLDEPVAVRGGDRFVLRASSPSATIGGGIVTDAAPPLSRVRPWPHPHASPSERLRWAVAESGRRGLAIPVAELRIGIERDAVDELVRATADTVAAGPVEAGALICRVAGELFDAATVAEGARVAVGESSAFLAANPFEAGAPLARLRSAVGGAEAFQQAALDYACADGRLRIADGLAFPPDWRPASTASDEALLRALRSAVQGAGLEPPSVGELVSSHGPSAASALRLLARSGEIVPVASDRYFAADAVAEARSRLGAALDGAGERTSSELREALGVSRKYAIPLLEYFDQQRITVRDGEVRRLRKP